MDEQTSEAPPPPPEPKKDVRLLFNKEPDLLEPYRNELMAPDASLYPSYTQLTIPYRVICRQRYSKAGRQHRKQFLKEHSRIELLQPRALHGVRFHKEFCENVLVPISRDAFIKLDEDEQFRLDMLLKNKTT